jgi:predicted glycosyltransferase
MKVWYDACTGKHVRYGAAIAKQLRKAGHEVILTTREHPDTLSLARVLGENPVVVGKYSPTSLFSRLEESAKRMAQLAELFRDRPPDVAISHQSVELCRVAFGLGVPVILTADTPHANAVNRLTVPLADTLIVSEAIPQSFYKRFGAKSIVPFRGVDEVAWVKDFKPCGKFEFEKPLIVVRQMETRASYALGKRDETVELAEKLGALGRVLFISRYERAEKENATVKSDFVDSASVVAHADLVVSVGGTISREAALQGVPSIVVSDIGRTYVNRYLAKLGFPLFITNANEAMKYSKKYLGKRFPVISKLARLENPVNIIERATTGLAGTENQKRCDKCQDRAGVDSLARD